MSLTLIVGVKSAITHSPWTKSIILGLIASSISYNFAQFLLDGRAKKFLWSHNPDSAYKFYNRVDIWKMRLEYFQKVLTLDEGVYSFNDFKRVVVKGIDFSSRKYEPSDAEVKLVMKIIKRE